MKNEPFFVKENSRIARLAAKKMRAHSLAIVFGKTIHLHNISKEEFLQDEELMKHELCHVRQYRQHGFVGFLIKYIWYWMRKGYYNNPFEIEARKAESE